jgi:hypothetical protein
MKIQTIQKWKCNVDADVKSNISKAPDGRRHLPELSVRVRKVFLSSKGQVVDVEEGRTPELFDRDAVRFANFGDGRFDLGQMLSSF